jgi:gluconate 2-dehydrogenase gamma chain
VDSKKNATPDRGRREFLQGTGAMAGGAWLAAHLPALAGAAEAVQEARAAGRTFRHLTAEEGADLEAMAARIVPTDDTPGATEAGAVWFMDEVLGGMFVALAPDVRRGLAAFNEDVARRTGKRRFSLLDEARQDELLRVHEGGDWFATVRFLTLAGLLAAPSYGGNRDLVGWKLIGFEHRHVWSPPFGHYDAQHEQGGGSHG